MSKKKQEPKNSSGEKTKKTVNVEKSKPAADLDGRVEITTKTYLDELRALQIELVKLQEKALALGANFVRPEGIMVYSTCTMNPEENERQIEKFLARNPRFTLIDASEKLPGDFCQGGMFRSLPVRHNMDGAFAAKMIKTR